MPILKQETSIFPENLLTDFSSVAAESGGRHWLAIYTKARQEKALSRQILSQEIPFYLPLIAKDQVIRGRRVQSYLPLFNGYLFLYASDEERVRCLSTNRISRILGVEDQAQLVVDLRQVHELIACDAPLTVERRLSSGDRVRVRAGALMGLEGTIIRRQKVTRLVVAVNYLQQGVSVEIDDCMVEPI
jgi:transcription antitermination factor NusG